MHQRQTPPSQQPPRLPPPPQRLMEASDPSGSSPPQSLPQLQWLAVPRFSRWQTKGTDLIVEQVPSATTEHPRLLFPAPPRAWAPFAVSEAKDLDPSISPVPSRTPTPSWTSSWTASVPCTGWRSSPSSSTSTSMRGQQRNSSRCAPKGWRWGLHLAPRASRAWGGGSPGTRPAPAPGSVAGQFPHSFWDKGPAALPQAIAWGTVRRDLEPALT